MTRDPIPGALLIDRRTHNLCIGCGVYAAVDPPYLCKACKKALARKPRKST
jgi:hypothetical protein